MKTGLCVKPILFKKLTGDKMIQTRNIYLQFMLVLLAAWAFTWGAMFVMGQAVLLYGLGKHDQPRTIDMKARGGKRLERVPETIMDDVLGRLATILT